MKTAQTLILTVAVALALTACGGGGGGGSSPEAAPAPVAPAPTAPAPTTPAPTTPAPTTPAPTTPVVTAPTPTTPAPAPAPLPTFTKVNDPVFEAALVALGVDDKVDGQFLSANAASVTALILDDTSQQVIPAGFKQPAGFVEVKYRTITDLTGIEAFVNLKKLIVFHQNLVDINLKANTALTELSVWDNKLSSLDVSSNTALQVLTIACNNIQTIDLSKNVALTNFNVDNTSCTSAKGLTSLNLASNTALQILSLGSVPLTSIDLSKNAALTQIKIVETGITNLSVSGKSLNAIWAAGSKLAYLNIAGTANNGVPTHVNTLGSPVLQQIQVTNAAAVNAFRAQIDAAIAAKTQVPGVYNLDAHHVFVTAN